jgi:hypothetical protein
LDSSAEAIVFRGELEQVKAAKRVLYRAFDALVGLTFSWMELAVPVAPAVGRMEVLSEISAISGAAILLDRDTSSLLLISNDRASTE